MWFDILSVVAAVGVIALFSLASRVSHLQSDIAALRRDLDRIGKIAESLQSLPSEMQCQVRYDQRQQTVENMKQQLGEYPSPSSSSDSPHQE